MCVCVCLGGGRGKCVIFFWGGVSFFFIILLQVLRIVSNLVNIIKTESNNFGECWVILMFPKSTKLGLQDL